MRIVSRAPPRFTTSSRLPTSAHPTRGLFCAQLLARVLDLLAKSPIARHLTLHFVHAVNDRGMIAPAESLADFHQLHLEKIAGQVHRDLARDRQGLDAGLGAEALRRHAPAARDDLLDPVDGRQGLGPGLAAVFSGLDLVR